MAVSEKTAVVSTAAGDGAAAVGMSQVVARAAQNEVNSAAPTEHSCPCSRIDCTAHYTAECLHQSSWRQALYSNGRRIHSRQSAKGHSTLDRSGLTFPPLCDQTSPGVTMGRCYLIQSAADPLGCHTVVTFTMFKQGKICKKILKFKI